MRRHLGSMIVGLAMSALLLRSVGCQGNDDGSGGSRTKSAVVINDGTITSVDTTTGRLTVSVPGSEFEVCVLTDKGTLVRAIGGTPLTISGSLVGAKVDISGTVVEAGEVATAAEIQLVR